MTLRLASTLLVLLCTSAFAQVPPFYLDLDDDIVAHLSQERVATFFDGETTRSPNGLRVYWAVFPDFMQAGPWSTAVYIADADEVGQALRLNIDRHANVLPVVRWINDELLYVQVWWGRIAASDLMLDVVEGEFLYRRIIYFPPDLPTLGGTSTVPQFELTVEHMAGALPPDWQAARVFPTAEARQIQVTTLSPMVTGGLAHNSSSPRQ